MKLTRLYYKAKKVTLSTQEKEEVVVAPISLEKPYTEEEIIYNDIVNRYPVLGDFVKETGLVFISTLEPPREIYSKHRLLSKHKTNDTRQNKSYS